MNEREKPKKGKGVRAHTKQATPKKPPPHIIQKKERGKKLKMNENKSTPREGHCRNFVSRQGSTRIK